MHGISHSSGTEVPSTPTYTATWIIAAIVMFLLKYVFCVVAAMMIHNVEKNLKSSLSLGIGIQLMSTFVTCFFTSRYSKIGINIAGPDIIAAIFASSMATIITAQNSDGSYEYPQESHLPTLLFLMWLTTFSMGVIWLSIGYNKMTGIVEVLPAPVVNGFLGCIGMKVLIFSWKVGVGKPSYKLPLTWDFWRLYLPIIPIGIPLYYLKKHHIGNPLLILPIFLLAPVALFYIAATASGFRYCNKCLALLALFV